MWAKHKQQSGFTIVAYNGIQNRAKVSAVSSGLSQAAKKISVAQVDDSSIPDCAVFYTLITSKTDSNSCIFSNGDINYQYRQTPNSATPTGYCITATTGTTSYNISNSGSPMSGPCVGHGGGGVAAITNLVTNPSIELSTAGWSPRKSATLTRSTTQFHSAPSSIAVVTPGAEADEGLNMAVATGAVSSNVAGDHMASAWVMAPSGMSLRIFAEEYSSSGVYIAGAATSFTGTGAWQRVSVIKNIVSASSKIALNVRTNTIAAVTYYVDDLMVTQGNSLYAYADGGSAGWVWNGTAHGASSTGAPF